MPIKKCKRTNIYLPLKLYEAVKEKKINLSAFVREMLEREFAGDFNQLKIDKLETKLALAKAEKSHTQTQQQKQKERAKESCKKVEEEALERRRQNMPRRRRDI